MCTMAAIPAVCALVAGSLCGSAWLLWVDGVASSSMPIGAAEIVPGILAMLGLVMLNLVSWEAVTGEFDITENSGLARCWVFGALCLQFSSVITGCWLLVARLGDPAADASAVMLAQRGAWQTGLLFLAALIFRAARTSRD